MMTKPSVSIPFGVSCVIHFLPVPGVLGSQVLERLYGIHFSTIHHAGNSDSNKAAAAAAAAPAAAADTNAATKENLVLSMQHRAVLFGSLSVGYIFTSTQSSNSSDHDVIFGCYVCCSGYTTMAKINIPNETGSLCRHCKHRLSRCWEFPSLFLRRMMYL